MPLEPLFEHPHAVVNLGPLDELWVGEILHVEVAGLPVVLIRTESGVYAYEDRCPHLGFALSRGRLDGSRLTCAAHGWEFDVDSGTGVNPCNVSLRAFAVTFRDGDILLELKPGSEKTSPRTPRLVRG